jgi:hypothetical protein
MTLRNGPEYLRYKCLGISGVMMNQRALLRVFVGLGLIAAVACTHSSGAGEEPRAARLFPPRIKSNPGRLMLSASPGMINVKIELPVGAEGRPDFTAIRFIGSLPAATRRDLIDYLQQMTFEPARLSGVPVAGIFKMDFATRVR